jgi:hypothetical protein
LHEIVKLQLGMRFAHTFVGIAQTRQNPRLCSISEILICENLESTRGGWISGGSGVQPNATSLRQASSVESRTFGEFCDRCQSDIAMARFDASKFPWKVKRSCQITATSAKLKPESATSRRGARGTGSSRLTSRYFSPMLYCSDGSNFFIVS